jgi:uncharacterized metal-binding protein
MADTSEKPSPATLLYACSGAANTGHLSDQVARLLARQGAGDMTCLVSMGATQPKFLRAARDAHRNIVIDGCTIACGKKIFETLGIPFRHFATTDFGVEKKKTPITTEVITTVASAILSILESSGGQELEGKLTVVEE